MHPESHRRELDGRHQHHQLARVLHRGARFAPYIVSKHSKGSTKKTGDVLKFKPRKVVLFAIHPQHVCCTVQYVSVPGQRDTAVVQRVCGDRDLQIVSQHNANQAPMPVSVGPNHLQKIRLLHTWGAYFLGRKIVHARTLQSCSFYMQQRDGVEFVPVCGCLSLGCSVDH